MAEPQSSQEINIRPATDLVLDLTGPTGSGVDRTDDLIRVPTGCRVVDGYIDVATAAAGAGTQTLAIQTNEGTPKVAIPATDTKTAALTRMVHNGNISPAAACRLQAVWDSTGAVDTAAVVKVWLKLVRMTFPSS